MAIVPPGYSYAAADGIRSLAATVVFVALYLSLLAFFVARWIARPSFVFFTLAMFCSIRITAFTLRALLSHVPSIAENLHVFIAYEIIYNIGFFGLLYSAYILATDRIALAKNPPNGPISRLLRLRFLFRLALVAAVAIGITGAIQSSTGTTTTTINTGHTLRKTAIYIFLVCAVLVLLQTFILVRTELTDGGYHDGPTNQIGATYGIYILSVISLLLVVRESFFAATADHPSMQNNEALWYPLSAVTEFIAVILFASPGLVPAHNV